MTLVNKYFLKSHEIIKKLESQLTSERERRQEVESLIQFAIVAAVNPEPFYKKWDAYKQKYNHQGGVDEY